MKMIFFVESSAISYCPVCGEPLSYRDSCVRIMRLEGGMKRRFLIRRLKCSNCGRLHRELPDELLTLKTCLGDQVLFLEHHPEIDLVAFCTLTAIRCKNPDEEVSRFTSFSMQGAPKPLRIPHMTQIDGNHFVMGKVPNLYVARTEKIRSIGWDEKIRMMDHQDFFWRAAGNLVSVIALGTAVFHYHNPFQKHYQKYRQDVERDLAYISHQRRKGL